MSKDGSKINSKNRINTKIILLVFSVVSIVTIGSIIAYFTDQKEIVNVFTVGNVKITLTEDGWDEARANHTTPQAAQNIEPGQEIPKAPIVNNVGRYPAYTYLKVYVPVYKAEDLFSYEINNATDENAGWIKRADELHVNIGEESYNIYTYEYSATLAPSSSTVSLFKNDKVIFAKNMNFTTEDTDIRGASKSIIIKAYAIQSENGIDKSSNEITETMISDENEKLGLVGQIQIGSIYVTNGETVRLTAGLTNIPVVVENIEDATYASSDTTVATIDGEGKLNTLTLGTTTITISKEGMETKEVTLEIVEDIQNTTIKVGDETVTDGTPIKLKIGDEKQITILNSENVTYSINSESGNISLNNGTITVSNSATVGETATITITGSSSGETRTIEIEVKGKTTGADIVPSINYGQKVNYSVTVNSVELKDWKLFMTDEDGYAYIIYGDYLKNAAIPQAAKTAGHLNTDGQYRVWSTTNRTDLINAMKTESYWSSYITSDLAIAATNIGKTAVATGGPTATQFKKSWNDQYTESQDQVKTTGDETNGWSGASLASTAGYAVAEANNMYFPHKSVINDGAYHVSAYWLASPSIYGANYVTRIGNDGAIWYEEYNDPTRAFRPLVRIPCSLFELNDDGISWNIAE